MKIGIGFDVHRVESGRKLILGGVLIPFEGKGLLGHSDGDVIFHAIADAIAGALAEPDIGTTFPDTDPATAGISSHIILGRYAALLKRRNAAIENLDIIILAEEPKLRAWYQEIRTSIAGALAIPEDRVGIKAKTMEGLGPIGEQKAIGCWAAIIVSEKNKQ